MGDGTIKREGHFPSFFCLINKDFNLILTLGVKMLKRLNYLDIPKIRRIFVIES